MYLPQSFAESRPAVLHDLIERHSFATLVTVLEGAPLVSHLPVVLDRRAGPLGTVRGHVARANPHSRLLGGGSTLAIFHGPHAYVSPRHYTSRADVPTWNYAVVHATGTPRLIEDREGLTAILAALTAANEAGARDPWSIAEVPEELFASLARGIVGFELPIERLEGKLKLGQNRQLADRHAAIRGLGAEADPGARAIAALMEGTLAGR